MPAKMEMGMVKMKASTASLPERPSAGKMMSDTLERVWYEVPKSSVNTRFIDLTYCSNNGLSVPNCALNAATSSLGAVGPSTLRPTSPGSTLTSMNTMVASSHSVTTIDASRWRMNLRTPYPLGYRTIEIPSGERLWRRPYDATALLA